MSTGEKVLKSLKKSSKKSRELSDDLGIAQTAVGFHLTKLKKEGKVWNENGVWGYVHRFPDASPMFEEDEFGPVTITDEDKTVLKKEPEPSIRLLLLAAQEGINEALARLDALENTLLGRTESL